MESEKRRQTLSVIVPCYNEEDTLRECMEQLLKISDDSLDLEIIIIDDCSSDGSPAIAKELESAIPEITFLSHEENRGKGAALRTGISRSSGHFVAIQDADLEYDPQDLKRLLAPIISGRADVVIGSRFIYPGAHRVLYFWHSVANKILTLFSNMLTDLNLTDIECCYKVFRSDVIKSIDFKENRFGIEPEIIAKIAHKRLRIYEMAVSYDGRTYAEGKKIGWKDAFRAIYCILHYNAPYSPPYIQFFFYIFVGAAAALVNMIVFLSMFSASLPVEISALFAFFVAALVNYFLSIAFVFRHKAKWRSTSELVVYFMVVAGVAALDLWATKMFLSLGHSPGVSKGIATVLALLLNYTGRRYIVFPSGGRGPWSRQNRAKRKDIETD